MKVTIDRAKWQTGRGSDSTGLFDKEENTFCCLGFLGLSCGASTFALSRAGYPTDLSETEDFPAPLFRTCQTWDPCHQYPGKVRWQEVFAGLNDARNIPSDVREQWIAEGFRTVLGVDVEFVGEYPEAT